jgi:hypothetical protein
MKLAMLNYILINSFIILKCFIVEHVLLWNTLPYVKNGKVFESLLGIYTTKELVAKNFTDLTLDIMEKNQFRHFASSELMLRRCQCHEWQKRRCCRINPEEIKEECAARTLC